MEAFPCETWCLAMKYGVRKHEQETAGCPHALTGFREDMEVLLIVFRFKRVFISLKENGKCAWRQTLFQMLPFHGSSKDYYFRNYSVSAVVYIRQHLLQYFPGMTNNFMYYNKEWTSEDEMTWKLVGDVTVDPYGWHLLQNMRIVFFSWSDTECFLK